MLLVHNCAQDCCHKGNHEQAFCRLEDLEARGATSLGPEQLGFPSSEYLGQSERTDLIELDARVFVSTCIVHRACHPCLIHDVSA